MIRNLPGRTETPLKYRETSFSASTYFGALHPVIPADRKQSANGRIPFRRRRHRSWNVRPPMVSGENLPARPRKTSAVLLLEAGRVFLVSEHVPETSLASV